MGRTRRRCRGGRGAVAGGEKGRAARGKTRGCEAPMPGRTRRRCWGGRGAVAGGEKGRAARGETRGCEAPSPVVRKAERRGGRREDGKEFGFWMERQRGAGETRGE
ncbi:unnamed protein product [Linum trigynum]|uniref:Uncharacterized protein n=1 Tax=Linum trigynum TaxID=586398 RepID=A0AAV2E3D4_9ROSI